VQFTKVGPAIERNQKSATQPLRSAIPVDNQKHETDAPDVSGCNLDYLKKIRNLKAYESVPPSEVAFSSILPIRDHTQGFHFSHFPDFQATKVNIIVDILVNILDRVVYQTNLSARRGINWRTLKAWSHIGSCRLLPHSMVKRMQNNGKQLRNAHRVRT
jgi:hypothetical protein